MMQGKIGSFQSYTTINCEIVITPWEIPSRHLQCPPEQYYISQQTYISYPADGICIYLFIR